MQFGRFSADRSEYIVSRFDTPRPWLNCIHNDAYGMFLSQTGFGYSFYRDSMAVKINYIDIFGYVPSHPQTGKFVYLHDADARRCWPAMPLHSGKGYSGYRCRHGQGYTRMSARRNGIEAELLFFVPVGQDPVELWEVTLRNRSPRPRRIVAFPYQQWQLTAPTGITDTLTYTRADWRADLGAIVARQTNPTSPLMYDAFMAADFDVQGHDCSCAAFLGEYAALDQPVAPVAGACTGSGGSGERICGALAHAFEIPPGGEVSFRVLTGVSFADPEVRQLKQKYLGQAESAAAFAAVTEFWASIRRRLTCKTPDPVVNQMANSWVKQQNYLTSRWCRGGYRGYRDVLQDVMGIAPLDAPYARHWLIETLRRQYANGLCVRGWNPISNKLDSRLHRDSPIWIPLTLSAILRETGEMALLDEAVGYLDSGEGTVFDHAMAGMKRLHEERAANGLCLIGDGDWNDSLDEIARRGKGQSVWLTMAAAYGMDRLAEVAAAGARSEQATALRAWADEMRAAVNAHGWDGRWYIYAITDDGEPVGSDATAEGKIHLNVQTWAIFSGTATGDRLASILKVIDEELDTPFGPVLIHPAYTRYTPGIGKVSGKNPGQAENGPIYSHGVAFKMLADFHLGRGDKALASYLKACPASQPDPARFQGEPYAASRYLIGPSCPQRFGASPYSFFTAWGPWTFQLLYERMLGVRPDFVGLHIDPCVPSAWTRFDVVRPWRGATYRIAVTNPDGVQRGVRRVTVDGQPLAGAVVPDFADGREHRVAVRMG
ncbi:MAG: Cellobiose phosphorylase [Phycisphaerae bacterium]|nr:Cellobiose phosphorylase [Phycisphaerae bacterium]